MNHRRLRFVEEYAVDLNATAAARRAGYRGSSHTLEVTGSELLRIPEVAGLIAEERARRSARTALTADHVVQKLAIIAFADVGRAYDKTGSLLPIHKIPENLRRAIVSIDPVSGKFRLKNIPAKIRWPGLSRNMAQSRPVTLADWLGSRCL